jgi:H+/Cl- antiporter ClcA
MHVESAWPSRRSLIATSAAAGASSSFAQPTAAG